MTARLTGGWTSRHLTIRLRRVDVLPTRIQGLVGPLTASGAAAA